MPVGEIGQEPERLHVLVAVDGPRVARFPVAAVVPHPDRPLGLRFLGTERQRVADDAAAERLDLARGVDELVPGLGRPGEAGAGEEVLVVEERARARQNREPVELALILAPAREGLDEVVPRLRRQHVVGRVEELVLGVAGEGVQVQHVRRLARLDHRADLLVDRVPVDDPEVDLHAALLRILLRQALPEGLRMVLTVFRDHHGDRLAAAAGPLGPPIARAEQERGGGAEHSQSRESSPHRPCPLPAVPPTAAGPSTASS